VGSRADRSAWSPTVCRWWQWAWTSRDSCDVVGLARSQPPPRRSTGFDRSCQRSGCSKRSRGRRPTQVALGNASGRLPGGESRMRAILMSGSGRGRWRRRRHGHGGVAEVGRETDRWCAGHLPPNDDVHRASALLRLSCQPAAAQLQHGDGTKSPCWRAETRPQPNRRPRSRTSTVAGQHRDSTWADSDVAARASSARQHSVASKSKPAGLGLLERRRRAG
jgi:hypothetical protein